jgi:hypothetical protein
MQAGRDPHGNRQTSLGFKEAGRAFTAAVVIGNQAPQAVRRDAMLILDRLRLDSLRIPAQKGRKGAV